MPKTQFSKLNCPYCQYEPWSQADLESHIKFAHGTAQGGEDSRDEAPPAPAQEPEAQKPTEVVETTEVVPEPESDKEKELPPGIFIPQPQPDFWVSERVGRELYIIKKLSERGEIVNVKLLGPAGVGKTSLAREFAAANKRPLFEINWARYTEPGEIWGDKELSMERGTFYDATSYKDALEIPNCVITNDEANRCHPDVLNENLDLWDWRRAAYVPNLKRTVRVAPGVVFFATMNEGAEYMATNAMDRAIRERFGRTIRLTWPPMKVEARIIKNRTSCDREVADKLARFAMEVRRNPKVGCAPSTRQLLVAAQDVKEGLPLEEAILYAVINDLDETVDRKALLQHLQIIGNVNEAYVDGQPDSEDDDEG